MFDKFFLSTQVKRSVIISSNHGIYELPHELRNDLRLNVLGNSEISGKSQNFYNSIISIILCYSLPPQMKTFQY